jgi:hypothetical protein
LIVAAALAGIARRKSPSIFGSAVTAHRDSVAPSMLARVTADDPEVHALLESHAALLEPCAALSNPSEEAKRKRLRELLA